MATASGSLFPGVVITDDKIDISFFGVRHMID
jgi:hypothetical protein